RRDPSRVRVGPGTDEGRGRRARAARYRARIRGSIRASNAGRCRRICAVGEGAGVARADLWCRAGGRIARRSGGAHGSASDRSAAALVHERARRARRAAFDRADAARCSGGHGGRRQRQECGRPRGADPRLVACEATACAASRLRSVISRYSRPAMARIWSDEGKLARWLDVELAALEAWAEIGAVPPDAVAEIAASAKPPSPGRVEKIEPRIPHDVAAFVDVVAGEIGDAGRWFHYGLTSSDVVDTGLALQIRDAGELLMTGLERAFSAVVARAEEHRQTLQIGRTHGIHAEPTTFGLKMAGWAFELDRDRIRLDRGLEGIRVGKLSGAVGTYAATDPEAERIACERLGLEPAPSSTQILQRDRHAELLSALAVTAASLEKFALEIRHLART